MPWNISCTQVGSGAGGVGGGPAAAALGLCDAAEVDGCCCAADVAVGGGGSPDEVGVVFLALLSAVDGVFGPPLAEVDDKVDAVGWTPAAFPPTAAPPPPRSANMISLM